MVLSAWGVVFLKELLTAAEKVPDVQLQRQVSDIADGFRSAQDTLKKIREWRNQVSDFPLSDEPRAASDIAWAIIDNANAFLSKLRGQLNAGMEIELTCRHRAYLDLVAKLRATKWG